MSEYVREGFMNITIQLDELKGKCLLTILTVFFLYVFWYQYAYNPISGTIPILTLIMTVLALPHYLKLSVFYYMLCIY